ncbi:hypothetical protein [Kocuria subflava]|uniref:hypothetical protein n=1 Tax=Kocuria subflava TaxID=1736139 RepID=UPI000E762C72|nr:hypothetical protein [Kocuria subflava]
MWRHTLIVRDTLAVRTVVLPLHDALMEDLLDTVVARADGSAEPSGHAARQSLSTAQKAQRAVAVRRNQRPLTAHH